MTWFAGSREIPISHPPRHPEVLAALAASLEGWATSTRGHPSRRRASARLLSRQRRSRCAGMTVVPLAARVWYDLKARGQSLSFPEGIHGRQKQRSRRDVAEHDRRDG